MQVWNAPHAARWKCRTQKLTKNRHLGTIPQLCRAISSQLRHISTIGKKLVKQQYLLHMSLQYGELRRTSGWDRFVSLGHPCKFQRVSHLGSVTAQHSSIGHQPNFRWTESGTHVRQGGHDVGHWSTSLVNINSTYIIWWWGLIIVIIYLRPFSQCKIQGSLCYFYLVVFMQSLSLLSCSCYLS